MINQSFQPLVLKIFVNSSWFNAYQDTVIFNNCDIYEFWQMFKKQLKKWQNFRKWQRENRKFDDDNFLIYVEWKKRMMTFLFVSKKIAKKLFKIKTDSFYFKKNWKIYQNCRATQKYYCREFDCDDDFFVYAEVIKRRLTQHKFTEPFLLQKNFMQQNELTTWIEYLNYEYWWFDWFNNAIQRLKPNRDSIWQKLKNFKILRPHETEEFLRTFRSFNQTEIDEKHARKIVEKAALKIKQIYTLNQLISNEKFFFQINLYATTSSCHT